ncbi:UNVERIFIED_CONTAM: hypothetical protein FKN15_041050 [Acipenser sinensis]
MDDQMREVYNYLSDNNYPPSYSMLQKLTLRRYASNFPFKQCGSVEQQFLLHLWIIGRHGYMHWSPRVVVGLFQVRSRQEPPMQQREVLHGYCTGGGVARTQSQTEDT